MKLPTIVLALFLAVAASASDGGQKLPSRDPATVVPLLKKLVAGSAVRSVEDILGRHDREAGSGRCIFVYILQDRSEIWVNTGDCRTLGWITRRREGQKDEEIAPAKKEPIQPPQTTTGSCAPDRV